MAEHKRPKGDLEWEDPRHYLNALRKCPDYEDCPPKLLKRTKDEEMTDWDRRITTLICDGYRDVVKGKTYYSPHDCSFDCRKRWHRSIFRCASVFPWMQWIELQLTAIVSAYHSSHAVSIREYRALGPGVTREQIRAGLPAAGTYAFSDNCNGVGAISNMPLPARIRWCCRLAQLVTRRVYHLDWIDASYRFVFLDVFINRPSEWFNLAQLVVNLHTLWSDAVGVDEIHPLAIDSDAVGTDHECDWQWLGMDDHWPRIRDQPRKAAEWAFLSAKIAAERTCHPLVMAPLDGIQPLMQTIFQFAGLGILSTSALDEPIWTVPATFKAKSAALSAGRFFRQRVQEAKSYATNVKERATIADRAKRYAPGGDWIGPVFDDKGTKIEPARRVPKRKQPEPEAPPPPPRPASQRERKEPKEFAAFPTVRGDELDAFMED